MINRRTLPPQGPTTITLLVVIATLAVACGVNRVFPCDTDEECLREGTRGQCVAPEGYCAFADPQCDSQLRWDPTAGNELNNQCVKNSSLVTDAGLANACGGTTTLFAPPGQGCGPCGRGAWRCDGPDRVQCIGAPTHSVSVASNGTTTATSAHIGAPSNLAIDNNETTSWFSTGPEFGGGPTLFVWTAPGEGELCIETVALVGNGNHASEMLREGFGFGAVTVQLSSTSGQILWTESISLPSTPDPTRTFVPNGLMARTITLLLSQYENQDRGGFSELVVTAF